MTTKKKAPVKPGQRRRRKDRAATTPTPQTQTRGMNSWRVPDGKLTQYHKALEGVQSELIDLDAQIQKDRGRINRHMDMLLMDLAISADVPIGVRASVQGRYFVEMPAEPVDPRNQVVRR